MPVHHLRGHVLPGGDVRDVYVLNGRITFTAPDEPATTIVEQGWITPGLVDAHAHLSLQSPAGDDASAAERVRASARAHIDAGVLLVREPGSPDRESATLAADDLPVVHTAGRFLAPPGRYFPGLARDVEPADLEAAVAEEAAASGSWVKVIGDFAEPGGIFEPNWTADDLARAARAAHASGARIAIHAIHPTTVSDAIAAGFDSIEHATGATTDDVAAMADAGIAMVPTLMLSSGYIEGVGRMLGERALEQVVSWLDRQASTVRFAAERGVTLLAGTDAGAVEHGRVAEEIALLLGAGVDADAALAAGSWLAREYLGAPLVVDGAPADIVAYTDDPRRDPSTLFRPGLIMRAGHLHG